MLITVCICTIGRPHLADTLRSIAAVKPPEGADVEVLVVDNAPGGPARGVVESLAGTGRHPVRYAVESRKGLSFARNKVLDEAHGDWLALIDDDEVAKAGWLIHLLDAVTRHDADAAIGTVLFEYSDTPPRFVVASGIFDRLVPRTGTRLGLGKAHTANAIVRRSSIDRHKLRFVETFNTTGGEDSDFFRKLLDRGGRIVSAPDAVVSERVPPERQTESYFRRHSLRTGETYARVMRLHGGWLAALTVAVRASANILAAGALMLVARALGKDSQHRYKMLLLRNAGKLRYLAGLSPIEMYAR